MTSSAAEQPPLMNGDDEDDPYKSEGRIEHKIENFSRFVQEELFSRRLSANQVNLCGVTWKVLAILNDLMPEAQAQDEQKCLFVCLQYGGSTDPSSSFAVKAKVKKPTQQKSSGTVYSFHEKTDHTFNGTEASFCILTNITVEDLMNPDRGWYCEQSDSITLAMDLTVNATTEGGGTGKYVLVAGNVLKLDKDSVPLAISMQIGHLEWEINFDFEDQGNRDGEKSLVLSCKDVEKGRMDKVLLEVFGYRRKNNNAPSSADDEQAYSPICEHATAYRHLFTRADNSLTIHIPAGRAFNNLLFTVRVYKQCGQFTDFTKPNAAVERFQADVKLRVGDQLFHVNKKLLSSLSPFFNRMFHGDHPDATKKEVELSLNTHSAQVFHDFLLALCFTEVLPNSINLAALFKSADFYNAENVRKKCDQHLRKAREIPIEKRVLLARKHGSEETKALLIVLGNATV